MIKSYSDNDPIRKINTKEVLLSEREVYLSAEQGVLNAFKDTSNPCLTKILSEVRKSIKMAYLKPIINK